MDHPLPRLGSDRELLRLDGIEALRAFGAALAGQSRRSLELVGRDLEPRLYDQPAFLDGVRVLATGSRYAVRFKVNDGNWRTWKRRTQAQDDIFGRDDDPVNFDGTKTYKIQARSQKRDPDKHSGWSPPLVIP